MKNLLLFLGVICFAIGGAKAQTILFEDDFESYDDFIIENVGDWTLVDNDGHTDETGFADVTFPNQNEMRSYIVFNPNTTEPPMATWNELYNWDFSTHSGEKYMLAKFSFDGPNDDWLISPAVALPNENGLFVKFSVKAPSFYYPNESFKVLISTTDTQLSSFQQIDAQTLSVAKEWIDFTYDLDEYAGQTVYIAIQYVSDYIFAFLVDDFMVGQGDLGTMDLNSNQLWIYPNPVESSFKIQLPQGFNSSEFNLKLLNLNGEIVKTFKHSPTYSIPDLPSGIYILEIQDGMNQFRSKLIKK